ncbi:MAG: xanthine dehydrogenase family protein subunit M [Nitrososphaerota archaeon]|nr:xanthine dehydrogenase family protein subunit M [Nitrososphaerota archaeon]
MRNELRKFGYFKPTSVGDAVSTLDKYGGKARVMAGGTDLLGQIKDGLTMLTPQYVVDIGGLGLSGITFNQADGLRIGAATHVADVLADPNVKANYGALFQAVSGHPVQIANQATVAGDITQEVWCWYLRSNYDCWRNGGTNCYAAIGDNRYYHSIFGGNLCYAVHAGDIAPALFALGADLTIASPGGSRTVPIEQFMPGTSIVDGRVKENILRYNEIITQVHIPSPPSGSRSAFFKVSDRTAIDFALASCAVSATFSGSTVSSARVVLGAVAEKPLRASSAEQYLSGKQLTEDVIAQAASTALTGATPLTYGTGNQFRVFIAEGAVKKALRSLSNSS